jgi:phosphatidylserine decarboxylase
MTLKDQITGAFVKSIPRRVLSQFVGHLVFIKLPQPFRLWSIRLFAWKYKINMQEAEYHITNYHSIGDLFVRKLKPGLRPLSQKNYVHPCDAKITQFGIIQNGQMLQVKNWTYSVANFLGSEDEAKKYEGGGFITYYLCPTDYHRVHSPLDGVITHSCHVVGDLWPVNDWSVSTIKDLFAINERVVTTIQTQKGLVSAVMVGATNVGKMAMSYDTQLVTNKKADNKLGSIEYRNKNYTPGLPTKKGQELGVFFMGSTVVMLFTQEALPEDFSQLTSGPVKLGAEILKK